VNNNLDAALEYASLGLPVFPAKPASKKPAVKGWPDRASIDPATIRKWFTDSPDANVAIRMGDGVTAIDIDPRNGGDGSYTEMVAGRELPDTATAVTGGGGRHYFYRSPVPIGTTQGLRPGIDIKGRGSYVLAEPSVHPDTAQEYAFTHTPRQGIALAPDWLLDIMTRGLSLDSADVASPWNGPILEAGRVGDIEALYVQVVNRFPSQGVGTRNEVMKRVVASLIGRGFDDQTTLVVTRLWWRHFHSIGEIGTDPRFAEAEIRRTIRSIRTSPVFRMAIGPDHRAACRAIQLTDRQSQLLDAEITELIGLSHAGQFIQTDAGTGNTNHKSLTLTSHRLCEKLCSGRDERAFAGAVVVHVIYKINSEPGELIHMTGDQIRQVASDRGFAGRWDDRQMERLKRKYFWRPGKPATRFELLREVVKGDRKPGVKAGTPSAYAATGIRVFLTDPGEFTSADTVRTEGG
jgi:Bifunctional DNA primase/polymerase, N-terminal